MREGSSSWKLWHVSQVWILPAFLELLAIPWAAAACLALPFQAPAVPRQIVSNMILPSLFARQLRGPESCMRAKYRLLPQLQPHWQLHISRLCTCRSSDFLTRMPLQCIEALRHMQLQYEKHNTCLACSNAVASPCVDTPLRNCKSTMSLRSALSRHMQPMCETCLSCLNGHPCHIPGKAAFAMRRGLALERAIGMACLLPTMQQSVSY